MHPADAATVRSAARGRGGALVAALAPHVAEAVARGRGHGPCPLCGGRDRFRAFGDFEESGGVYCNQCAPGLGDLFATLRWANGWTFPQALEAVAGALGLDARNVPPVRLAPAAPAPTLPAPDKRKEEAFRRVWSESRPLEAGDVAARYLAARGLALARFPDVLRYHVGLPYFDGSEALGTFPSLVARVDSPAGELVSVHRTYLALDGAGKAPVPSPRKLCSPAISGGTRGAAIRLHLAGPRLAVAEGVETSLAVHLATGLPTWATVSAGGMARVELPQEAREVLVAADHDPAGINGARTLARRLLAESRRVILAIPPEPGADWLDIFNAREAAV